MSGIPELAVAVAGVLVVVILTISLAIRLLPKSARGDQKPLADDAERVEELERRVGELEAGQHRVAELEDVSILRSGSWPGNGTRRAWVRPRAEPARLANRVDAGDLNSQGAKSPCRFESCPGNFLTNQGGEGWAGTGRSSRRARSRSSS